MSLIRIQFKLSAHLFIILQVLFSALAVVGSSFAHAQMANILPPALFSAGRPSSKMTLKATTTRDKNSAANIYYKNSSVNLTVHPIPKKLFLGFTYTETKLSDETIQLDNNISMRSPLQSLQFSTGYSFKGSDDSDWSIMGGYGSKSDDLFKQEKDNTIVASVVNARPGRQGRRWILGAFYNSNMSVGSFPLPVVAYLYQPSPTFSLIAGLPFLNLRWGSFTQRSLFLLITPGSAKLQLTQSIVGPFAVSVGSEWGAENYQHVERISESDKFFIEKKNIYLGFRAPLLKSVMLRLKYGYRFDSRYFESEGAFDVKKSQLELKDSAYFSMSLGGRF